MAPALGGARHHEQPVPCRQQIVGRHACLIRKQAAAGAGRRVSLPQLRAGGFDAAEGSTIQCDEGVHKIEGLQCPHARLSVGGGEQARQWNRRIRHQLQVLVRLAGAGRGAAVVEGQSIELHHGRRQCAKVGLVQCRGLLGKLTGHDQGMTRHHRKLVEQHHMGVGQIGHVEFGFVRQERIARRLALLRLLIGLLVPQGRGPVHHVGQRATHGFAARFQCLQSAAGRGLRHGAVDRAEQIRSVLRRRHAMPLHVRRVAVAEIRRNAAPATSAVVPAAPLRRSRHGRRAC